MADQGTTEGTVATTTPDAPAPIDTETQAAPDAPGSILSEATTTEGDGSAETEGQPKSSEDAGDGENKEDKSEQEEGTVPEAYEFTAPEGQEIDPEAIEKYTPLFKELGLSQEAAQKIVDAHQEAVGDLLEKQAAELGSMVDEWKAEFKALPDSDKLAATAKRVVDKYAKESDPDTYQFLTQTWAGSHPGLVKMLARIGEHVLEDSFEGSSAGGGGSKDFRAVFPSMKNP